MLQKIRRRDLILLIGVLSLACLSMIIVALLVLRTRPTSAAATPTPPGPTRTPGPAATHTVTFVQVTGFSQLPIAETAAKNWSADAELVSANANWPQILNESQIGEPVTWHYRFYSPAKKRIFLALVGANGQLRTVEHRIPITLPPPTITMGDWATDSPTAMAVWLDYGGNEMVRSNPGFEMVVQLRQTNQHPKPVWTVIGFDERTDDLFIIVVDATDGTVVVTSPDG